MEDVRALERDAAVAADARRAAVEQVFQRRIGADEVRGCRRRQRSRGRFPRQFDEVGKGAGSAIGCSLAAQVGDVAAQHFDRDGGVEPGPAQLERQDDAGPQRRIDFDERAAFREVDELDVVTRTAESDARRAASRGRGAPPLDARADRSGRLPHAAASRRCCKTDREGDGLSGFRRKQFERTHRRVTCHAVLDDDRRNLELALAEGFHERVHDVRIEVGSRSLDDDFLGVERRHRLAVGAVARQRVVDVGH